MINTKHKLLQNLNTLLMAHALHLLSFWLLFSRSLETDGREDSWNLLMGMASVIPMIPVAYILSMASLYWLLFYLVFRSAGGGIKYTFIRNGLLYFPLVFFPWTYAYPSLLGMTLDSYPIFSLVLLLLGMVLFTFVRKEQMQTE
ncbi:MAG: hypothetical protein AAF990_28695 [Bacteroidota bacterium]